MKRPLIIFEPGNYIPGICLDHIRFSCYADQYLTGYDIAGTVHDLITFYDHPDCGIYENIRCVEQIKQKVSTTFLKHISCIRHICFFNIKILCLLSIHKKFNVNLEKWIDHVKVFYKLLLSEDKIYEKANIHVISVKEIERALESVFQLEELNLVSGQFKPNNLN